MGCGAPPPHPDRATKTGPRVPIAKSASDRPGPDLLEKRAKPLQSYQTGPRLPIARRASDRPGPDLLEKRRLTPNFSKSGKTQRPKPAQIGQTAHQLRYVEAHFGRDPYPTRFLIARG